MAAVTRPPPRYNEATLLSAMEGAGKLIDDEELREAMREKGLGTPATRAQIIEGLIAEKYILREGKELVPTAKAFSLMTLLRGLDVPELFSPELTAEWEFKLAQMEHGNLARDAFMREIVDMTEAHRRPGEELRERHDPGRLRHARGALPEMRRRGAREVQEVPVPVLRFRVLEDHGGPPARARRGRCAHRAIATVGPLEGFRSKLGRPFAAALKLNDANEVTFDFGDGADDENARGAGLQRAGAARAVPEVWRARVRDAAGVRLREVGWAGQDVRLPVRAR